MAIKHEEAYGLNEEALEIIKEVQKRIDQKLRISQDGFRRCLHELYGTKEWWKNNKAAKKKLKSLYTEAGWHVSFHDIFDDMGSGYIGAVMTITTKELAEKLSLEREKQK